MASIANAPREYGVIVGVEGVGGVGGVGGILDENDMGLPPASTSAWDDNSESKRLVGALRSEVISARGSFDAAYEESIVGGGGGGGGGGGVEEGKAAVEVDEDMDYDDDYEDEFDVED